MNAMKIALVIKTSLDFDGRVISQIDALSSKYPESKITILLLPDKKTIIEFAKNVSIKEIKLLSRKLPKTEFWQFFKMIEYGVISLIKLFQLKPNIIHVHDENSILGPLIYKKLKPKVPLVYDDHELKNLPPGNVKEKLMLQLEKSIFKSATLSIVANESRKKFISKLFKPQACYIIENWLYNREIKKAEQHTVELLDKIKHFKEKGKKIILHQGFLNEERGISTLKTIVDQLPDNWLMLFIGVEKSSYDFYFKDNIQTYYGNFISNQDLQLIWGKMDAVVVFYSTNSLNNKYCAPNRLYLALNLGIPVIINKENPELQLLLKKYKTGISVTTTDISEKITLFFLHYSEFKTKAVKYIDCFEYKAKNHPIIGIYNKIKITND